VLKIVDGLADLVANARRTGLFVHLEAPPIENIRMVIPQDDLQLRPANLDAEIKPFVHDLSARLPKALADVMKNLLQDGVT
jgi:hypothetical protein